jgi:hypothetical protein
MKRLVTALGLLLVVVSTVLLQPVAAFADSCADDPTCFGDDEGFGIPGWFVAAFVLVFVAGIGLTVYRIVAARGMATRSGMDPSDATRVALLDEDGLSATYLASQLRGGQVAPTPAPPAAEHSTADRLRKLEDLRTQGLVTEDEYAQRRTAILDEL